MSPASREKMKWFRDARFGMFLTWSPGCLSGLELSWGRKGRPFDGGHEEDEKTVSAAVYDQYYKQFNPFKFNAREWVKIASDAGMKYIVFTTKHHDGFANFHTKQSDYNIANTPFKRDIVRELTDACHEAGVGFGAYYSPRDWYHPDYLKGDNSKYRAFYAGQLRELLTNYGEIDILWFDNTTGPVDKWDWQGVMDMIYKLQPDILVNDRYGNGWPGDFYTPEQVIGAFNRNRPWESCTTLVDGQWSFRPGGIMCTLREALGMLLGTAGGDGNLLLNVGPTPAGEIEPRQAARLREVGAWLKQYGAAVYGTRGGPYISGHWGYCTLKENRIYLHLAGRDTPELALPPLGRKILSSRLLSGGKVEVLQNSRAVKIRVPERRREEPVTVVELAVDGSAIDIEPIHVPPTESLSRNRPVTSGSNGNRRAWWHNPCAASQAVDDSPHTRWRAEEHATAAWLAVDLIEPATINRAMIDDDDTVTVFEIQALVGEDWKTVYKGKTIGKRLSVRFKPVTTQHVRLYILEACDTPSIWEFQVYGRRSPRTSKFVNRWQMSRLMPKTAGVGETRSVKLDEALDWRPVENAAAEKEGFINVHSAVGDADGIVYLGNRFKVGRAGRWTLHLGHDGGVRVFVDGKSVLCDPKRANPAVPDRSSVTVSLGKGEHEIVIALDTDHGMGWGIFCRFEVPEAERKSRSKPVFPVVA